MSAICEYCYICTYQSHVPGNGRVAAYQSFSALSLESTKFAYERFTHICITSYPTSHQTKVTAIRPKIGTIPSRFYPYAGLHQYYGGRYSKRIVLRCIEEDHTPGVE